MKRLISIAVSVAILGIIYWRIDFAALVASLVASDLLWLAAGLLALAPITAVTAWRFTRLVPDSAHIDLAEAVRLTLAASSLNLVLPSKMGDLAKAWFIRDRGHMTGSLAVALVVFEKTCDMLALLVWCVFGLLLYADKDALFWVMTVGVAGGLALGLTLLASSRITAGFFLIVSAKAPAPIGRAAAGLAEDWEAMHAYFWSDRRRVALIAAVSLVIWFMHLGQIWLLILALNAAVPFLDNLALAPLAILAGLLPLTFAGIGTRDAALIFFFAPFMAAPVAAALGVLCTLRYVLPAIAGLPFLGAYLAILRAHKSGTSGAGGH
ncbi:MAG: flippase-like domain-containing protein [Alphaproteobacteria bacterium]|nr:flippase-like domain-containing protein [Alphaproteobacteria bacterium]